MLGLLKRFFKDEEGMGVVEIVIIIAVLVGIAILFRQQLVSFAKSLMEKVFNQGNTEHSDTDVSKVPKVTLPPNPTTT